VQLVQFAYPDEESLKLSQERWGDGPKAAWMDDLMLLDQENLEDDWLGARETAKAGEMSTPGWFDNIDELEEQYIRLRRQELDGGRDQKS
jgi:hypothetical protein